MYHADAGLPLSGRAKRCTWGEVGAHNKNGHTVLYDGAVARLRRAVLPGGEQAGGLRRAEALGPALCLRKQVF